MTNVGRGALPLFVLLTLVLHPSASTAQPAPLAGASTSVVISQVYGGGDRTTERGPFVQFTYGKVTVGGYWFNPGASDQVAVGMVAVGF